MRFGFVFLAFVLAGCSTFTPIPEQAETPEGADPPAHPCFVAMSEPRAPEFLLRDIPKNLDAGWWRWTGARPAVHCRLPEGGAWQAAFDYHVADATLKDTGPITLTFTVNGQQAGRQRCERAEEYHFRAPVPAGLARPGADLVLEAAVDHPWVSPSDGVKLGVLVTAAGFVRQ